MFNPTKSAEQANSAMAKLLSLESECKQKRLAYIEASAKFQDKENEARENYFNKTIPLKVSELRDYVKHHSHTERRTAETLRLEIKNLEAQIDTMKEVINVLKYEGKMASIEMSNLNFNP